MDHSFQSTPTPLCTKSCKSMMIPLHPPQIRSTPVDDDPVATRNNHAYILAHVRAKYSFLWESFYNFGETDFGLWLNEFLLDLFCFEPFKECLSRPFVSTNERADMVVSVHPLCQDTPLKILANLDSDGKRCDRSSRETPFVTVVTDLGGAHKTWFNKK